MQDTGSPHQLAALHCRTCRVQHPEPSGLAAGLFVLFESNRRVWASNKQSMESRSLTMLWGWPWQLALQWLEWQEWAAGWEAASASANGFPGWPRTSLT